MKYDYIHFSKILTYSRNKSLFVFVTIILVIIFPKSQKYFDLRYVNILCNVKYSMYIYVINVSINYHKSLSHYYPQREYDEIYQIKETSFKNSKVLPLSPSRSSTELHHPPPNSSLDNASPRESLELRNASADRDGARAAGQK